MNLLAYCKLVAGEYGYSYDDLWPVIGVAKNCVVAARQFVVVGCSLGVSGKVDLEIGAQESEP